MTMFLSHYFGESPVWHECATGGEVYVLTKSGAYQSVNYLGYMLRWNARFIPGARRVKVRAYGVSEIGDMHHFSALGEGWYLMGIYVAGGDWNGVFVLCNAMYEPIAAFAPYGLAPAPRPGRVENESMPAPEVDPIDAVVNEIKRNSAIKKLRIV